MANINPSLISELQNIAHELRKTILELCIERGGHLASSLSCVEILVALYYGGVLRYNPHDAYWNGRDRLFLSKGHAECVLYNILSRLGYFPVDWIKERYLCGDYRLGGHTDRSVPGIEFSGGSLGHGLGIASGMAWALQNDNKDNMNYVILGDGECAEGSVWESASFASKHKLNNLIAIVDYNKQGCWDFTSEYMDADNLPSRFKAFGWNVESIDGHNFNDLLAVLHKTKQVSNDKPTAIIAHTVKGKGISYMEGVPLWHVKVPRTMEEISIAREELKDLK